MSLDIKDKGTHRVVLKSMAQVRSLCWFLVLIWASTWPIEALAQQASARQENRSQTKLPLSPEATQVANHIEVTNLLERLRSEGDVGSTPSLATLTLRQEITERVLAASLDVDSVTAVIDLEIEEIRSIRSELQSQHDKAQNIINVASLVTGGALGVVNTALQFKSSTANLGNAIGVGGGAASVVLSVFGIRMQGKRRTLGDSPRMLARFFESKPTVEEAIPSVYPAQVWTYLDSAPPSEPAKGTRREQLIAKWRQEGKIGPGNSLKDQRKVERFTDNVWQARKLSISELDNRLAMLMDVRTRVSLMKRELGEILRSMGSGISISP